MVGKTCRNCWLNQLSAVSSYAVGLNRPTQYPCTVNCQRCTCTECSVYLCALFSPGDDVLDVDLGVRRVLDVALEYLGRPDSGRYRRLAVDRRRGATADTRAAGDAGAAQPEVVPHRTLSAPDNIRCAKHWSKAMAGLVENSSRHVTR